MNFFKSAIRNPQSAIIFQFAVAFTIGFALCSTASSQGLRFSQPWLDLGRVKSVGNLERRFDFQSTSTKPIEILEVRPSCGCLRPRLDKKIFAAGEKGCIVLGIHATSQKAGKHRFSLAVTTREDRIRTYDIGVEVELFSDIVVEPSNLLIYVDGKAALKQNIVISDRRAVNWRIVEATSSDSRIRVREIPNADLPQSGKRHLEVAIAGNFPPGRHEARVEVRTDDDEYRAFEIPVTVAHEPRVTALPAQISIAREALSPSSSATRMILIRDSRGAPVRVESATSAHPGVHAEMTSGASPRPICKLRFDRDKLDPPVLTEIRIRIAEPQPGELIVSLRID